MEDLKNSNNKEEIKNDDNSIPIEREESETAENANQINNAQDNSHQRISELEKQIAELKDVLLRKAAEFENYKRRTETEQLNIMKYASEPFIKSILPIYDDLERSILHIEEENSFEKTKKGLQMVFDKFSKIFENQGIKRIEAKGTKFDVSLHEALMQQPVKGVDPHTVVDVIEHGYMYKDRVLRHSKVIVSAESTDHSADQNSSDLSEAIN